MGHKSPRYGCDWFSYRDIKGCTETNDREGYIVIDFQDIDRKYSKINSGNRNNETRFIWTFITPEDASEIITDETLLVIVDTHKPSMVIDERLLNRMDQVVVIDHHRRSDEFISHSLLVYMEPYASSTAELVTELLE